eukprot:611880-Rhodomonas_salina.2
MRFLVSDFRVDALPGADIADGGTRELADLQQHHEASRSPSRTLQTQIQETAFLVQIVLKYGFLQWISGVGNRAAPTLMAGAGGGWCSFVSTRGPQPDPTHIRPSQSES